MYHLISNSAVFSGYNSFHSSGQRFDEVVQSFNRYRISCFSQTTFQLINSFGFRIFVDIVWEYTPDIFYRWEIRRVWWPVFNIVRNIVIQPCSRNNGCMCSRAILLEHAMGVVNEEASFRDRSRSIQSVVNWF